ncbi:unnamed protein product [marine sediment metagenome]|uniref:DUF5679 domain-containing protein n=1 Tax=marine sediment metagenome TaxID=412755 RepID=X0U8I0_9ZZZZ
MGTAATTGSAHGVCYAVHSLHGGRQMEGYCVKCRSKQEIKDPQKITMKNGRPATQGTCPTCGTKIFKIGG